MEKWILWNKNRQININYYLGITDSAGPCLATYYNYTNEKEQIDLKFIVVILDSESMEMRWD